MTFGRNKNRQKMRYEKYIFHPKLDNKFQLNLCAMGVDFRSFYDFSSGFIVFPHYHIFFFPFILTIYTIKERCCNLISNFKHLKKAITFVILTFDRFLVYNYINDVIAAILNAFLNMRSILNSIK